MTCFAATCSRPSRKGTMKRMGQAPGSLTQSLHLLRNLNQSLHPKRMNQRRRRPAQLNLPLKKKPRQLHQKRLLLRLQQSQKKKKKKFL
mmetsp:Transcript_22492/g.53157  ORF Transcript_22492/g.53157 Transcript_22492/m.53157 type:complete len:89 (+) Transcript_22492:158-424(+)